MKVARYPLTQSRLDRLNALQEVFKTGVTTKTIDKALDLAFKYLKHLEREQKKLKYLLVCEANHLRESVLSIHLLEGKKIGH